MSSQDSQPEPDPHAGAIGYHPLVRAVDLALRSKCRVPAGASLLVAVSGGADSVALLLALATLSTRRTRGYRLAVGHVQHGLRPCAENDAAFVKALAERFSLPFFRADLNLAAASADRQHAGNIESIARKARYRALTEMASGFEALHIATAHHADDQLETLLMRLARGAGTAGLSGMAWRRPVAKGQNLTLVRPMLAVDRQMVLGFLEAIGQPYCTDPTNLDLTRARANLRANVLPVLKKIHPGASVNAARSAQQIADANKLMNRQALALLQTTAQGLPSLTTLQRQSLRTCDPALLSHAIRLWLTVHIQSADHLGSRRLAAIVKAIQDHQGGTRTFDLSHEKQLVMTWTTLTIG
jgi:tRNA(Ile)-lysidine synthase